LSAGPGPPNRFFLVAIAVGVAFANMAVAIPLQALALGSRSAVAGALLATGTVSIAFGAVAAGALASRIGGGERLLGVSLVATAFGSLSLVLTRSIVGLAGAAVLVGAGVGLFWVSSQLVLGRRSGTEGSERAFLRHYAAYTLGTVAGSSLTGVFARVATGEGIGTVDGIRFSALLGVAATVAGAALWSSHAVRQPGEIPGGVRPRLRVPLLRHLVVQLPDLLLVGALALLLPLAPVVLARGFHLDPLSVGLVMGAVALSKIAGTFTAQAVSRLSGQARAIVLLLASGASFCLTLCIALTVSVFVAGLLATALAATGAWPLVVDSAQARVEPDRRRGLTVLWNVREYSVIAVATVTSGWLFGTFGTPAPLFVIAAVLFAAAAVSAVGVFRRPVWSPQAPQPEV
jgi:Major Facilitator Superfamily